MQTLAAKKNKLAAHFSTARTVEESSIEELCTQFQSKLADFLDEWSKLLAIKSETIDDDLKMEEIKRLTNGETESLILNGNAFIHGAGAGECASSGETNEDFNKRILQYLFENIDQNAALRNTKVGELFYENGTKLDLVK